MELWIKAFHIMAVIAWMAGLFYLPRLFVYHAEAEKGSEAAAMLATMERRLLRMIMNPALLAAWVFGLWAAVLGGHFSDGWFHAKMALVIALTVFHMALGKWRRELESVESQKSARFFRLANEVPTVLMIAIVLLVVLRPF